MDEDKIILVQPGFWEGSVYKNGEEVLVFTSLRTKSYEEFLDEVHEMVQADRRYCDYVLHYFIHIEDGKKKSIIMSDSDLQRSAKIYRIPKIYASVEPKFHGMDAPSNGNQSFNHLGVNDKKPDGFVRPMPSQGAYGNPFACDGRAPVGYNFTTDNIHCPVPYWFGPYFHGAGSSSAPYFSAPYPPGPWPSSAPIVDQLGPRSKPVANQPRPSSAPTVNQPKPSTALVFGQLRPNSTSVADKRRPNSAPVVNQPRLSSTPAGIQPGILKRVLEVDQPCKPSTRASVLQVHDQYGRMQKRRTNEIEDDVYASGDDDGDDESSC